MKRTPLKRGISQLKRSGFTRKPYRLKSRVLPVLKPLKISPPKIPLWIKAIPQSSAHGAGNLQKRLWRLVSDYVRCRDWYAYDGRCVATGRRIERWQDGNAGHFKAYSKCNAMFKFDETNIHLQSAQSNSWGDLDDWKAYEAELIRRYGEGAIRRIETQNNIHHGKKPTDALVIAKMEFILAQMSILEEQPEYYPRVMMLKDVQETQ